MNKKRNTGVVVQIVAICVLLALCLIWSKTGRKSESDPIPTLTTTPAQEQMLSVTPTQKVEITVEPTVEPNPTIPTVEPTATLAPTPTNMLTSTPVPTKASVVTITPTTIPGDVATINDAFSKDELELMYKIVEAEVTGEGYFENKVNVASVILNRIKSDGFPDTLYEVLTQETQFTTYSNNRYNIVTVTQTTIDACAHAYMYGDTTGGALFFSMGDTWAKRNRPYLFTDSVGHDFFL